MALAQRRSVAASRRVAIVAADAGRLHRLRAPLLRTIAAHGHKLLCLTGSAGEADTTLLAGLGAETGTFPLGEGRMRALRDRSAIDALARTLADWKPTVVLGIGLKPMWMAALAARRIEGARVVLVAPSLDGLSQRADGRPGFGTRWLARRALKEADALVLHNHEHETHLRALDLLPAGLPVRVLPGAGVDLVHYQPTPLPSLENGLVFAMITRRDRAKGIETYVEAARRMGSMTPKARFVLATWPSGSTLSGGGKATAGEIDLQRYSDVVEIVDAAADVRPLLAQCHVFVLPSPAEGMAHEVVEALACGRPAITSDIAGCREIVDERVSGVLVPPGDAGALAAAMQSFLRRPDQLTWMAQASRHKAERRFDANAVTSGLLEVMDLVHRG